LLLYYNNIFTLDRACLLNHTRIQPVTLAMSCSVSSEILVEHRRLVPTRTRVSGAPAGVTPDEFHYISREA